MDFFAFGAQLDESIDVGETFCLKFLRLVQICKLNFGLCSGVSEAVFPELLNLISQYFWDPIQIIVESVVIIVGLIRLLRVPAEDHLLQIIDSVAQIIHLLRNILTWRSNFGFFLHFSQVVNAILNPVDPDITLLKIKSNPTIKAGLKIVNSLVNSPCNILELNSNHRVLLVNFGFE